MLELVQTKANIQPHEYIDSGVLLSVAPPSEKYALSANPWAFNRTTFSKRNWPNSQSF